MTSYPTPVDRPLTRVIQEADAERLKGWLRLLKIHTEDGTILALIDLALDGKTPLDGDYIRDNSNDAT